MSLFRRFRRSKILILSGIFVMFTWNFIHFKRIELQLDDRDDVPRLLESDEIIENGHFPSEIDENDDVIVSEESGLCPETVPTSSNLIEIDSTEELLDDVQENLRTLLEPGGFYKPQTCKARHRVAIIVPYRSREKELAIFLKNIHTFLMEQQLEYRVYVVEQTVGTNFNRAMLLNVGFLEARKEFRWDCYIFHDVDLLPLDNRILYTCSKDNPRHLTVQIDDSIYTLPSYHALDGVIAVTSKQFRRVNGFSNRFWGWDGANVDFGNRLKEAGYRIDRYATEISRYTKLQEERKEANLQRLDLLQDGPHRFKKDGLNSAKYVVQYMDYTSPAYTWIFVILKEEVPGEGSNVEFL